MIMENNLNCKLFQYSEKERVSKSINVTETYGSQLLNTRNSPVLPLMKKFNFIFILFNLIGLKITDFPNARCSSTLEGTNRRKHKKSCIKYDTLNCYTCFVYTIVFLKILMEIFLLWNSRDFRFEATLFATVIFYEILHYSIYRKRQEIFRIVKDINRILNMFSEKEVLQKKYLTIKFFVFSQILIIIWGFWLCFQVYKGVEISKGFLETISFLSLSESSQNHIFWILMTLEMFFFLITKFTLCFFVTYYMFTCQFIQILFKKLPKEPQEYYSTEQFHEFLKIHELISNVMKKMDDNFSFPALISALITMMTLFRTGYKIAFHGSSPEEKYLFLIFFIIHSLSHQLALMISGALTNEMARNSSDMLLNAANKVHVDSVKGSSFRYFHVQANRLTLWKIYSLDRSFLISSFGSLITFGILLGTLGK